MTATATATATAINDAKFLYWTSIAIHIDNPCISRTQCMKNAIKELRVEKILRSFLRSKSQEIKKQYPEYSKAECIKASLSEWKKRN